MRASKFIVSPVFTVTLSDVRAAFGLPGPMPPHPAREWEIIRTPRSTVILCLCPVILPEMEGHHMRVGRQST